MIDVRERLEKWKNKEEEITDRILSASRSMPAVRQLPPRIQNAIIYRRKKPPAVKIKRPDRIESYPLSPGFNKINQVPNRTASPKLVGFQVDDKIYIPIDQLGDKPDQKPVLPSMSQIQIKRVSDLPQPPKPREGSNFIYENKKDADKKEDPARKTVEAAKEKPAMTRKGFIEANKEGKYALPSPEVGRIAEERIKASAKAAPIGEARADLPRESVLIERVAQVIKENMLEQPAPLRPPKIVETANARPASTMATLQQQSDNLQALLTNMVDVLEEQIQETTRKLVEPDPAYISSAMFGGMGITEIF